MIKSDNKKKPSADDSALLNDLFSPEILQELEAIAHEDFRHPEDELRWLIHRRFKKLSSRQKQEEPLTKGHLSGQQKGVDVSTKTSATKILSSPGGSKSIEELARSLKERESLRNSLNSVVQPAQNRQRKLKTPQKNAVNLLFKSIHKELENMSYLLVDLDDFVNKRYRPLHKSRVDIPRLLNLFQKEGYFISLDLEKARRVHGVVFHDRHDFFLSHSDHAF